ncbi:MAG: hypothetical protein ABI666_00785 [Ferruginibacter sp.]
MPLRRTLFILIFFVLGSCHSNKKESVEGFYEPGVNQNDTVKFVLDLQKDSVVIWNPDLLAAHIADCNQLDASAVGFAGMKTEQYMRYEKLSKFASDSVLIRLTDYGNPVVRVYAFWALHHRNSASVITIFKRHITDKEEVKSFSGCIQSNSAVNKSMLACLRPYKGDKSISLSRREFKKYLKIITGSVNEWVLYF